ncbi:MAG TPA: sugar transferase [Azospirillum sp.]
MHAEHARPDRIPAPARRPLGRFGAAVKRTEDLLLGVPLLVALLPVMLVIGVLVRLDSPGPALFRQPRTGFHDRLITVRKFRTMRNDGADVAGVHQEEEHDPRVTRVGRVLRRLRLDELPQLLNVVEGTMSLVGPRPYPAGMMIGNHPAHDELAKHARRRAVKPGITGWAQVNGLAGPVTSDADLRRRIAYDLHYVHNWTVLLDLAILVRTAWGVARQALRPLVKLSRGIAGASPTRHARAQSRAPTHLDCAMPQPKAPDACGAPGAWMAGTGPGQDDEKVPAACGGRKSAPYGLKRWRRR